MKLSILDQSPILSGGSPQEALAQTSELAKWTDELGYHRFWVSEHHSTDSLAGSAPEVLAAHLASQTKKIRIGTGGVLLPHYSSYKVAEAFRILETLHPNRVDVGIGRAPGGKPNVNLALNRGKLPNTEGYPQQVEELMAYLHGYDPHGMDIYASPKGQSAPPVWMLGSSGTSARVAADLGTSYSFAHFINGRGGTRAVDRYKDYFTPSTQQDKPAVNVSVFVICSESDEKAEYLATGLDLALLQIERGTDMNHFPTPEEALSYSYSLYEEEKIRENRHRMIVGCKERVKEEMVQLADDYGVDELIVNTIVSPFEERMRSYELLADAFSLNKEYSRH
ncbi:LLM class flavin-dependent oxidoreductase [Halobacillus sp. ACCC02827]|uniref:LLM class flavin-dependent oxidoreductase n=1 Tax=Halobacillus sp. ACCC02827 TaxID=3052090 RepID=UPI0025708FF1|nr:LLM class flavin-dependent oxidoreductase [Halobacillus sp. ACCC02827]WJE16152.1 LLM class flavin-dependent oxidoreductase [Halobacillus sp. ACCC02827]